MEKSKAFRYKPTTTTETTMGCRRHSFQFVHVVTAWGLSAHVFQLLWSNVLADQVLCFNHQPNHVAQYQLRRGSTLRSGGGATTSCYERKLSRQQLWFHDVSSDSLPLSSSTPRTKDCEQPTTPVEGASTQEERSSMMIHPSRREWLVSSPILMVSLAMTTMSDPVYAAGLGNFGKRDKSSMYVVDTRDEMIISVPTEIVDTPVATLSSEYALLKILPVKNPVFRTLETKLEELSALRFKGTFLDLT
jgi:hypothetical protein